MSAPICAGCGQPLPYAARKRGRRYCSRVCWQRGCPRHAVDPEEVRRLLNRGLGLRRAADLLGLPCNTVYAILREAGIVRIAGAAHRPGYYGRPDPRNPRQLAWW